MLFVILFLSFHICYLFFCYLLFVFVICYLFLLFYLFTGYRLHWWLGLSASLLAGEHLLQQMVLVWVSHARSLKNQRSLSTQGHQPCWWQCNTSIKRNARCTGLPLQIVFTVNRIGTGFKHLNKPIQKIWRWPYVLLWCIPDLT